MLYIWLNLLFYLNTSSLIIYLEKLFDLSFMIIYCLFTSSFNKLLKLNQSSHTHTNITLSNQCIYFLFINKFSIKIRICYSNLLYLNIPFLRLLSFIKELIKYFLIILIYNDLLDHFIKTLDKSILCYKLLKFMEYIRIHIFLLIVLGFGQC